MKILIIGFAKLRIMPYLNLYLDNIDRETNEVSVIYWNRDLIGEDTSRFSDIHLYEFMCYQEDEVPKLSKIRSFVRFRLFVLRILKCHDYDRVVVLHSLPGVLLFDILIRKYSGRFVIDYRDSTFEQFVLFRKILGCLIRHSIITLTSSDAFRMFFPEKYQYKVFTTHNILEDSLRHRDYNHVPSDRIRVAFWGLIRHEDVNRAIIKSLANDVRFELHYYGREQSIAKNLKDYVCEIAASNVFFHGEYEARDRYAFARVTDVIHNIYFDRNTMLAMGNKYYDGLLFRIPQVCMPCSFMGELCEQHRVGIALSPFEEGFANKLYSYVKAISKEEFDKNADKALGIVLGEYNKSVAAIKSVLS